MPRKKPMPAHLDAFLRVLEAQDPKELNRVAALDAAEKEAGRPIVLEDALKNAEFSIRYRRWLERLTLSLQDAHAGRVMAGRASAAPLIAALSGNSGNGGDNGGGGGRPIIRREHASRKAEFSRRW